MANNQRCVLGARVLAVLFGLAAVICLVVGLIYLFWRVDRDYPADLDVSQATALYDAIDAGRRSRGLVLLGLGAAGLWGAAVLWLGAAILGAIRPVD